MLLDKKSNQLVEKSIHENRVMNEVDKSCYSLKINLEELINEWAHTISFTNDKLDRIIAHEGELFEVVEDAQNYLGQVLDQVEDRTIDGVGYYEMVKIEKKAKNLGEAVLDVVRRIG